MPRKEPYRLKHYHELKMAGSFSPESVINLIQFATAFTLQKTLKISDLHIPVERLDLYDVSHVDTGKRRSLGSHGNDTRVYKSQMTKINSAPLTGRIALIELSMFGIGLDKPDMQLCGRLEIDDLEAIQQYAAAEVVQETLREQLHDSYIPGRLAIGQPFNFGKPEFRAPPNENYDGLVNIQSFNDKRFTA